ncbi:hypothetical protein GGR21_001307 [Dysgonomonas hofstadii]|uniref:Uncharacterized protein n=1 Tax=Dysgonomonas hofstadii TaxID=637886 RepID=A0A840CPD6_9BACT|nr:hypothetical protein [Dysgonomonas hofstadii]MBB4035414.1 hypothetical protein [Dysgonomonas hofstadii]
MKHRDIALAKQEENKAKTLFESDFLLGVYDPLQMGAFRLKIGNDGDFLDNNKDYATPPWIV